MCERNKSIKRGCLYVCGTPIGNLGDITYRAIDTLKQVDYIAAEDTRQTLKLLNYYGIRKPLISCHEHNEEQRKQEIIRLLRQGYSVALVTDAGMPIISDPGSKVVEAVIEQNLLVSVVPGPTAVSAALAISGFSGNRYVFEGFLPQKKKDREQRLDALRFERRTIVLYEAPHHLLKTLNDLLAWLGDRPATVARELTKLHEETVHGGLSAIIQHFEKTEPKGEMVIIIKGYEGIETSNADTSSQIPIEQQILAYMNAGMSKKEAIKRVAEDIGKPKSEIYKHSIDLNK